MKVADIEAALVGVKGIAKASYSQNSKQRTYDVQGLNKDRDVSLTISVSGAVTINVIADDLDEDAYIASVCHDKTALGVRSAVDEALKFCRAHYK